MTPIQLAELHNELQLQHLIHVLLWDGSRDNVTYAIIVKFLLQHKYPIEHFVLYPQLSLRWKPEIQKDTQAEVPDVGVSNFTLQAPYFKIHFGVESKRMVGVMGDLPEPITIQGHADVLNASHDLIF